MRTMKYSALVLAEAGPVMHVAELDTDAIPRSILANALVDTALVQAALVATWALDCSADGRIRLAPAYCVCIYIHAYTERL